MPILCLRFLLSVSLGLQTVDSYSTDSPSNLCNCSTHKREDKWRGRSRCSAYRSITALCIRSGAEEDALCPGDEPPNRRQWWSGVSVRRFAGVARATLWSLWSAAADNHETELSFSNYSRLCANMRELNSLSWQVVSVPCCKWDAVCQSCLHVIWRVI